MLLAALLDAGVPVADLEDRIAAVAPEHIVLRHEQVHRGAVAARRTVVDVTTSTTHRGLSDVIRLIEAADLPADLRDHAVAVFTSLAEAEGSVHGVQPDQVHFHEVGALDAIADIIGVCAGFVALGLTEVHAGPVALGGGSVSTDHGRLSVPPPAVVALLRGRPTVGGPVDAELCTPTGAALLRHWVTHWGFQPAMRVVSTGVGAGGRDFVGYSNVVRLLVGEPVERHPTSTAVVIEANVDDLDPRIWPYVVQRLLAAGAADAWLTPIVMKKGRSAHTISVLVGWDRLDDVRRLILTETTAIGLRLHDVDKYALEREFAVVDVSGETVRVKIARLDGHVVNVQPEYEDVVAAATRLGWPVKRMLAAAHSAAADWWTLGD